MHKSITVDRICEAVERHNTTLDNPGFCVACGEEQDGCEPDAERHVCGSCGERQVYGAEQLLIMVA